MRKEIANKDKTKVTTAKIPIVLTIVSNCITQYTSKELIIITAPFLS
jgi:hypothetical protein